MRYDRKPEASKKSDTSTAKRQLRSSGYGKDDSSTEDGNKDGNKQGKD